MKRSTYVWTVLALALVVLLAVACEQPANPSPQNTEMPTDVAFPTDYVPPGVPTLPGAEGKATTAPVPATQAPAASPKPSEPTKPPAPQPTAAVQNPTAVPQPTAAPPAATATTASAPPAPAGEVLYTVKPGDNLFRIALAYGLSWQTVAAHNGITNPNAIYVGQVIKIPSGGSTPAQPPASKTYVVQEGDNLFRIALAYGLSFQTVAQYNGISWPYWVYPGQVIRIP